MNCMLRYTSISESGVAKSECQGAHVDVILPWLLTSTTPAQEKKRVVFFLVVFYHYFCQLLSTWNQEAAKVI